MAGLAEPPPSAPNGNKAMPLAAEYSVRPSQGLQAGTAAEEQKVKAKAKANPSSPEAPPPTSAPSLPPVPEMKPMQASFLRPSPPKPAPLQVLYLNANNTCTFFYNPTGNSVQIASGDRIYVVGDMTNQERIELTQRIRQDTLVYGVDIPISKEGRYQFYFVTNKSSIPFTDCHFGRASNLRG